MGCHASANIFAEASLAKYNRGNDSWDREDLAGALQEYTEALRLNPHDGVAYCNRAVVKVKQGDLQSALADCDAAVCLDPSCARNYANRAYVHLQFQHVAEGLEDCQTATTLAPRDPVAWGTSAQLKELALRYTDAVEDWNHVIRLRPSDPTGYEARGVAKQRMGNGAGAEDLAEAKSIRESKVRDRVCVQLAVDVVQASNRLCVTGHNLAGRQLVNTQLAIDCTVGQAHEAIAKELKKSSRGQFIFMMPGGSLLHACEVDASLKAIAERSLNCRK